MDKILILYILLTSACLSFGFYLLFFPKKTTLLSNGSIIKVLQKETYSLENIRTNFSVIRYFGVILLFVVSFFKNFSSGSLTFLVGWIIISSPSFKIKNQTLIDYIYKQTFQNRIKQYDSEIYRCALQLRNMAKAQENVTYSSDIILERLLYFSKTLKPIYTIMLNHWLIGQEKQACAYFKKEIGTRTASDFSSILEKLSILSLEELIHQLDLFISYTKEERISNNMKKQETVSYILYIPMVMGIFFVLWNFVIIVITTQLNFNYM